MPEKILKSIMKDDRDVQERYKDFVLSDRTRKKLQGLAIKVDEILREELKQARIKCRFEARIYNARTVGVQGDERTYGHPAEITIKNPQQKRKPTPEKSFYNFLAQLSSRITNEISGVNRVVYPLNGEEVNLSEI